MKWKQVLIIVIFFLVSPIFLSDITFAAKKTYEDALPTLTNKVVPKTGIATTDIGVLAGQGIKAALGLVGLIFFGLMVYGGFLWMTARGAEDQAEKAKNTVTTAVIGIAIIVSAYAITAFVTNRLLLGK